MTALDPVEEAVRRAWERVRPKPGVKPDPERRALRRGRKRNQLVLQLAPPKSPGARFLERAMQAEVERLEAERER